MHLHSEDSRRNILVSYQNKVAELRELGRQLSLSDKEIDDVIENSFAFLEDEIQKERSQIIKNYGDTRKQFTVMRSALKVILYTFLLVFIIHMVLTYHKPTYNIVVRNVQEFIHPCMKLLRWIALPVVKLFPSVTVLYDELCLVENPFFQAVDINCWPCADVRSVLDLSETDTPWDVQPHSGFPFIMKGASAVVVYKQLQELYQNYQPMIDRDAYRITTTEASWATIGDVLDVNSTLAERSHTVWRLNRLEPTRLLRQLFKRPKFLPKTINVERFVLIDEPRAEHYELPFPEGYKVFLMQASGERLVVLEPVEGCAANCTRVSVLMKPSYFLYYNSWFYRPQSYPVENTTISIGYMGSF
ncbi:uncharacterized protein LOC134531705 [Bacillus rossius redtenbacheri]|uniref:uncharacterized protein LOC134531705 n=1 Tax=Bacillus rossius redtenbacheri TaxID=93214 RepID=UPI002FDDDCCD